MYVAETFAVWESNPIPKLDVSDQMPIMRNLDLGDVCVAFAEDHTMSLHVADHEFE